MTLRFKLFSQKKTFSYMALNTHLSYIVFDVKIQVTLDKTFLAQRSKPTTKLTSTVTNNNFQA